MALIVESGSVVPSADSWATLTEARALAAKYGITLPADDTEAEVAMRNGGAYVNGYADKEMDGTLQPSES